MEKVFLNDKIIDAAEAKLSISESAFLYGSGLFELMRADKGSILAIDDHLERLLKSAVSLSIKNTYTQDYIKNSLHKLLEANNLTSARIRLTLTNGPISDKPSEPTLLITATQFNGYPAEYYDRGIRVVLTDCRENPMDPLARFKTICYHARLMVLEQAYKKNAVEALWFNTKNILAQGCTSNIFLVKDSVVYTPQLQTPAIAGIARKNIIQLCQDNSIEIKQQDLTISDMLGADEVFLTNMMMLIMPVNSIESHTVSDGKPGAVTKKLLQDFKKLFNL
ncbi:MAG: aminotransferase class IV [Victivallales bacterium]|nr:aminotransferase class IV [Victivallales bacterium]